MKRQVRTQAHCYINALGSFPHDEYPKETEISEDRMLDLNTMKELWLSSMSLRLSNSPRVHSFWISWKKITDEALPTWIGIKVAVSLYDQCCARILPCKVVEDSRIFPRNTGWGLLQVWQTWWWERRWGSVRKRGSTALQSERTWKEWVWENKQWGLLDEGFSSDVTVHSETGP